MSTKKVNEFLKESNAIEDVFDDDSLLQAQRAWKYLMTEKEMNMGVVLKTHKILMLNQLLKPNERGYFRTISVYIGGKEAIHYSFIRDAMEPWCMNAWLFPDNWKGHHIRYEKIHPFVDGNGRTGRMFMNWQRLKANLPILVIKNAEKGKYYEWFK